MVLKESDVRIITEELGHPPNEVEDAIFENLWSEHCAYRTSKPLLQKMPSRGEMVVVGPGDDAAIIKVDDGLALAIAMESHNHPSYVDPYDGAATGVGGIVRDVISMGAQPIALMDCLYFGHLEKEKNRYLFEHVVQGISNYGNCIGVPVVNGEVFFHPSYDGNPLVNVVCIGLCKIEKYVTGRVKEVGSKIILIGSSTGRDGLGGASFASHDLSEESEAFDRPSVQIGDPYTEKLLIDATLEAINQGYVLACRDLGAAGLSGASSEMCSTLGGRITLDAIPLREAEMTPREILVSESQERMVLEVSPKHVDDVLAIARKYDLNGAVIGEVIEEPYYIVEFHGDIVANIPIKLLTEGAPLCIPEFPKKEQRSNKPVVRRVTLQEKAVELFNSLNVASKEWVYRQYDHEVQTRTIVKPGEGAAVISVNASQGIALSSGCNPTQVAADPFKGAAATVLENAMNLAVKGARPIAFVNCLNFGNPEKEAIFYQLEQAVNGLSYAARIIETPIVGGNVSLYNESEEFHTAIIPTPSIGMVGILNDVAKIPSAFFNREGDVIIIVGETYPEYGGSEFAELFGIEGVAPKPRLDTKKNIEAIVEVIETGKISSANDIGRGGILIALAHMCEDLGANVDLTHILEEENELFSETCGRAILTVRNKDVGSILTLLKARGVTFASIGTVVKERLAVTIGRNKLTFPLELVKQSLNTLSDGMRS
ncbi:MAG: phosphoribosylformylglycinamidine synthase subunit PurL [Halobacteriota archaeon]